MATSLAALGLNPGSEWLGTYLEAVQAQQVVVCVCVNVRTHIMSTSAGCAHLVVIA